MTENRGFRQTHNTECTGPSHREEGRRLTWRTKRETGGSQRRITPWLNHTYTPLPNPHHHHHPFFPPKSVAALHPGSGRDVRPRGEGFTGLIFGRNTFAGFSSLCFSVNSETRPVKSSCANTVFNHSSAARLCQYSDFTQTWGRERGRFIVSITSTEEVL